MWRRDKAEYSSLGDLYSSFHRIRVRILKETALLEAMIIRRSLSCWTKFQSNRSDLEVRESISFCA